MSSKNDKISRAALEHGERLAANSKSMEDEKTADGDGGKTSLAAVKWHSAPSAGHEDERSSAAAGRKPTATTVDASTGGVGGWKPLQRQKVVTAASTLEEDEDGGRPAITFPSDGETDRVVIVGGGGGGAVTERVRKRAVVSVRRGYSCQESSSLSSSSTSTSTYVVQRAMTVNSGVAVSGAAGTATENRRRWLSADTGDGHAVGNNSKSMECLPSSSPHQQASSPPAAHHRASFIMAATDDRKSLDSCLDDVVAAEMADRRRGMFASTRTSVPSHLSLALPSTERRLTILSPHTHTAPSYPAASVEAGWHFRAVASSSSSTITATAAVAVPSSSSNAAAARSRKKSRPGMVLPRLVLPGSTDLDIFSQ